MPRFTVKRLLLATTLVCIGVGMIACLEHSRLRLNNVDSLANWAAVLFLWFGGGASIGAGLLTPFQRPWIGAVMGVAFQLALIIAAAS